MNFEFNQEQQLISDSVARFVQENYDLESRLKYVASNAGYDEANWRTMAELGWLGLSFSEADGGFGGNQIDTMLVMEQFGKGLVAEPYLASIVLGGNAIARGGDESLRRTLLPGIIEGSIRPTLAYAELQARFDLHDITTVARPDNGGYLLSGKKSMVANANTATHLVISARTSGGQIDTHGITLFVVPIDAAGVQCEHFPTVDGLRASEVTLENVRVESGAILGEADKGFGILESVILDGILAVSAEAVGAMEMLYKDTVEYTQTREQFDHPLSDFQVLQHRMVDMFMEYEQCKSLLYRATMEVAEAGSDARRTVYALKHLIGKAGIFIGENAVQLHGGMGMTEELRIGHYFKRILVIDAQFGNADHHLQQFAA